MAELFGKNKSTISRHLSNIYKEEELDQEATVAKKATVQIEGHIQSAPFPPIAHIKSVRFPKNHSVSYPDNSCFNFFDFCSRLII